MFAKVGFLSALVAASFVLPAVAETVKNPLADGETWADLRYDVFGDREIKDGSDLFTMDAPYRAEDAAIVPITLKQKDGTELTIKKMTLIVDENLPPLSQNLNSARYW